MSIVEKTFRNGDIIVNEGANGNSFFQLIEGRAFVYAGYGNNDQIRLATLEAGEFFGEMAILEAYPRSATVVATGTVHVIEIPGDELYGFLAEDTDRIYKLMQHLGDRLAATSADCAEANELLKQLREADAEKKTSLFSKIKKHMDVYQSSKSKTSAPGKESISDEFAKLENAGTGRIRSYSKGMIIFREGDVDNNMYILHEGTIGIYGNYRKREEEKHAEYNAVSFFGETGILYGDTRSASAVADTGNTVVESISREDLGELFAVCPGKILLILRHLSYRLRQIDSDFLAVCKEITETYNKK